MKKILFYYNHQDDIGHLVRLLNIIKAIRRYYSGQAKIFVMQGGRKQKMFPSLDNVHWIDLPHPFYSRINLRQAVAIDPEHIKLRVSAISSHIKSINPDIFISEFFPFGRWECRHELLPVLSLLRRNGVKIYASLPMPYFIHSRDKIKDLLSLCTFYDKILIHCPEELDLNYLSRVIDIEKRVSGEDLFNVFKYLEYKICFTGYVMHDENIGIDKNLIGEDYILVQRGGGTTSPALINYSISAVNYLENKYKFLVVAGPATTKNEMAEFRNSLAKVKAKAKNIKFVKFLPSLFSYIKDCRLCITTAGGTAYELLYLKKSAILVPFMGYPGRERADQLSRAKILQDYIGATVLDYSSLSGKVVAQAINKKISLAKSGMYKKINSNWFLGARVTADKIMGPL